MGRDEIICRARGDVTTMPRAGSMQNLRETEVCQTQLIHDEVVCLKIQEQRIDVKAWQEASRRVSNGVEAESTAANT